MKIHRALAVGCIVLVSPFANADEQKPDPKVLALSEAVLAYCAKAAPSTAAQYRDKLRQVTKGASEQTLADLRNTEAYRNSRETMDAFLAKVDEHNAEKVCSRKPAQGQ